MYWNTHKLINDNWQRSKAKQVDGCPFSAVAECKRGQWEFSVQMTNITTLPQLAYVPIHHYRCWTKNNRV
jgi:hypothetical protein